jgi:ubiquinone/menaquinone biosynthesis C-methylase UbiE
MTDEELLSEQVAYYRARAPEYDQWWLRRSGRYALPGEERARWQAEIALLEQAFDEFAPRGEVLELACGTGLWTTRLVRFADRVTAVDASTEVMERNRAKLSEEDRSKVDFVEADLFAWEPDRRFDVVFFSFWLSHVPPTRFEAFWALVDRALVPGGRVLFIDNQEDASTESGVISTRRQLTDGRRFEIVKVFYEPAALAARLRALGWEVSVTSTGRSFMMGRGGRMVLP